MSLAQSFLTALFGEEADELSRILIWTAPSKHSFFARTPAEAAAHAVNIGRKQNVYFGCGLAPRGLAHYERAAGHMVRGIPGIWADIDIVNPKAHSKTVMFLAPCAYQLQPLIAELRRRGIPFHNPYRRGRSDWNPLHPDKGVSSAQRLLAYLEPHFWPAEWLPEQIIAWGEMLAANAVFNRGMKSKLAELKWPNLKKPAATPQAERETWGEYARLLSLVFQPEAYAQAGGLDIDWLLRNVTAEYQHRLEFPAKVAAAKGTAALKKQPQIVVGTIHSVKGGQADVTYLCPDISAEAYKAVGRALASGDTSSRDEIIRQFYVGMTRCRETLILARPATAFTARGVREMQ